VTFNETGQALLVGAYWEDEAAVALQTTTIHQYEYDQRKPSAGSGQAMLVETTRQIGHGPTLTVVEYVYDGDGNRVQQIDYTGPTAVTTTYTNDILGLVQVLVASNGLTTTHHLFGLDLIQQSDGTQTRILLTDGLGSIRTEMVGNNVDVTITYEPFGNLLERTGNSGTAYGFTGEQHDRATGLLYLRARYYNPGLRLFSDRDAYPGSMTRPSTLHDYSYVSNDPVNKIDPSSLCEEVGDEACWSIYENIIYRFPQAEDQLYPYNYRQVPLQELPAQRLRIELRGLEQIAQNPSAPSGNETPEPVATPPSDAVTPTPPSPQHPMIGPLDKSDFIGWWEVLIYRRRGDGVSVYTERLVSFAPRLNNIISGCIQRRDYRLGDYHYCNFFGKHGRYFTQATMYVDGEDFTLEDWGTFINTIQDRMIHQVELERQASQDE
ncbi:MAG: RHS repeat-associated core domain-containing protein, partial [Chloroflexi bacterium]|nr:RHS repeat-associated core domain-containing protein [Chloroflexota bacterium]